ncbi:toll/interleukin-1 receptor domain-containing protein [Burkholderia sp. USMB20]|uniref:toll/interleukin-1 receptor domain-containing protein n=1 Tax=Burkholderia sp. USMB20 TaxID=1571773 RepID=UPI00187D0FF5|nr:toll/interleukin-1 receptor domain-containing protein [Burkholderia sp. USMB20]
MLHGAASAARGRSIEVEFHFPDDAKVRQSIENVVGQLKLENVHRIPHAPWQSDTEDGRRYAWLLSQLRALDSSNVTIAIGGHVDGSANMLLQVADGKRKHVLPFPVLGGAAKLSYERRRYELEDKLGLNFIKLQDHDVEDSLESMINAFAVGRDSVLDAPSNEKIFISYPRARQAEADHVETLLRRRNITVFRDESDFGAGHSVVERIREAVFEATVFIALWSAEYACSPWCFDEFELALDRHSQEKMDLWIIRTDETRIVPTRARDLIYHTALTRQDLESRVIALIDGRIR